MPRHTPTKHVADVGGRQRRTAQRSSSRSRASKARRHLSARPWSPSRRLYRELQIPITVIGKNKS